jgi:hypothetical protein
LQRRPSYFSRASQPRESDQPLHSESRPATSLSLSTAAAPHQLRASTAGSSRSHPHHPHIPPRPATSHSVPDARELSIDGAKTLLGSTLGVPKLSGISAFQSPGGLHAHHQQQVLSVLLALLVQKHKHYVILTPEGVAAAKGKPASSGPRNARPPPALIHNVRSKRRIPPR